MASTLFWSLEELLALHEVMTSRYGGAPGVRDRGLVQSARARSGYYSSLSEQAAARAA